MGGLQKSGMESILFLLLAFLLFGIKKAMENLHMVGIDKGTLKIAATFIELMILLVFFVAVAKRD